MVLHIDGNRPHGVSTGGFEVHLTPTQARSCQIHRGEACSATPRGCVAVASADLLSRHPLPGVTGYAEM